MEPDTRANCRLRGQRQSFLQTFLGPPMECGPGSPWGFKVEPTLGELQDFQLRSLHPDRDGDEHTYFSNQVAGKATSVPTAKVRGSRETQSSLGSKVRGPESFQAQGKKQAECISEL